MKHSLRVLRTTLAILLAILLQTQTCLAQVDAWERVKLIETGKQIHVKLNSGKTVKGSMDTWSTETLSVRKGKEVVPIAKPDVAQVKMVLGMSRGAKAATAGGIGGAVGGAVFGGLCAAAAGDCDVPAAAALGGAIIFGGIAAGIGALFPRHQEVIYTAAPAGASQTR